MDLGNGVGVAVEALEASYAAMIWGLEWPSWRETNTTLSPLAMKSEAYPWRRSEARASPAPAAPPP
jgi:hypothetical protein